MLFSACLCMCLWSISVWVNAKKNKMAIRVISNKKFVCLLPIVTANVSLHVCVQCENGQKSHLLKEEHTSVQIKLFQ